MERKRVYFAMMGTCLLLIVLAWSFVWRLDLTAAIAMSIVAMFIPPFAAVVGNAGVRGPENLPSQSEHEPDNAPENRRNTLG